MATVALGPRPLSWVEVAARSIATGRENFGRFATCHVPDCTVSTADQPEPHGDEAVSAYLLAAPAFGKLMGRA